MEWGLHFAGIHPRFVVGRTSCRGIGLSGRRGVEPVATNPVIGDLAAATLPRRCPRCCWLCQDTAALRTLRVRTTMAPRILKSLAPSNLEHEFLPAVTFQAVTRIDTEGDR